MHMSECANDKKDAVYVFPKGIRHMDALTKELRTCCKNGCMFIVCSRLIFFLGALKCITLHVFNHSSKKHKLGYVHLLSKV